MTRLTVQLKRIKAMTKRSLRPSTRPRWKKEVSLWSCLKVCKAPKKAEAPMASTLCKASARRRPKNTLTSSKRNTVKGMRQVSSMWEEKRRMHSLRTISINSRSKRSESNSLKT